METKFVIRNLKEVQAFLKEMPRGVLKVALKGLAEYILGNAEHGLRHNDPYRYVPRKRAYGMTFFSEAQRKFVMAKIRSGAFTPGTSNRTGRSAAAWKMISTNSGYNYALVNNTAGAYYTRGDKTQARQPAMVGWRKVMQVVRDNLKGAMRSAKALAIKWIRENKPK